MTETKMCSRCGADKPFSEFNKKVDGKFGLRPDCRACSRVAQADARNAKSSAEKAAYSKVTRQRHADKIRETNRAWRAANPEKVAQHVKRWASKNKERALQIQREWCKANPEKMAAKWRSRRALQVGAEGSHTAAEVRNLFTKQRGCCACCGSVLTRYHIDHMVALAAGGRNDTGNLQILCPPCNLAKGKRDPVEFMQARGLLL